MGDAPWKRNERDTAEALESATPFSFRRRSHDQSRGGADNDLLTDAPLSVECATGKGRTPPVIDKAEEAEAAMGPEDILAIAQFERRNGRGVPRDRYYAISEDHFLLLIANTDWTGLMENDD